MNRPVAVIGAGIAGLTAARRLRDRGLDVAVFDKARGVGGRTSVRHRHPFDFDHGAQYFTVSDDRFRERVETWQDAGLVIPWNARVAVIDDGLSRFSHDETRYVGVPGMNAIAKHLAANLHLCTQTRITKLTQQSDSWCLHFEDSTPPQPADRVILALPAPQAADLLPGDHALTAQLRAHRLSPCWAVLLGYDAPLPTPFDAAFVHNAPLAWVARNTSKPGRPSGEAWVLHATPAWTAGHLDIQPAEVERLLTVEFTRLPGAANVSPTHSEAHRWRYARSAQPLNVGCLTSAEHTLAVCGDWCQGDRIEGAFLSGLAAAETLL